MSRVPNENAYRRNPPGSSRIGLPNPRNPCVSVIIPNWNGANLLGDICLPSLSRQSFRDFSVIVVDNGSADGSCEYLETEWPVVRIVRLEKNYGFAGAVNRGISASRTEFAALVNNDMELDPRWLGELVSALNADRSSGSATGKILQFGDRKRISSVGDMITWDGRCDGRGRGELDVGQYDAPEPVFSATGGATLYRRAAIETVGLFDEDFFAYLEDVDWGFRAQLAGFSCLYVPSARAYHMGGATTKKVSGLLAFLLIRNTLWLVLKNFPASILIRNAPRILLLPALRSYRTMRAGVFRPVISAWVSAAVGVPRIMRRRRVIQRSRRVDAASLDRFFGQQDLGSPKLSRLGARFNFVRARDEAS